MNCSSIINGTSFNTLSFIIIMKRIRTRNPVDPSNEIAIKLLGRKENYYCPIERQLSSQ